MWAILALVTFLAGILTNYILVLTSWALTRVGRTVWAIVTLGARTIVRGGIVDEGKNFDAGDESGCIGIGFRCTTDTDVARGTISSEDGGTDLAVLTGWAVIALRCRLQVLVRTVGTCWALLLVRSTNVAVPFFTVVASAAWSWDNRKDVFALETGKAWLASGLTNNWVVSVKCALLFGFSSCLARSVGAEFTCVTQFNSNFIKVRWVNGSTKANISVRALVLSLVHRSLVKTILWAIVVLITAHTLSSLHGATLSWVSVSTWLTKAWNDSVCWADFVVNTIVTCCHICLGHTSSEASTSWVVTLVKCCTLCGI
jgi:hypothetical protein